MQRLLVICCFYLVKGQFNSFVVYNTVNCLIESSDLNIDTNGQWGYVIGLVRKESD